MRVIGILLGSKFCDVCKVASLFVGQDVYLW